MVAPWCIVSNMPKRVSKKNYRPDYQGSLAEYKESTVEQSGGYVTDPQNENMRGTAKFNTSILSSTTRTELSNNLWRIGQSEGARRDRFKSKGRQFATLPPPQFIGTAPLQRAAYDDFDKEGNPVNYQGGIARGAQFSNDPNRLQHFKNQTKILVNPMYKDYYDKVGNDPDSHDRVDSTAYKAIPRGDIQKVRDIAAGINRWAKDTSVYFGKEITIGKSPNVLPTVYPKDQQNTLNLIVGGFRDPAYGWDANRQIAAGYVSRSDYKYPDKKNNTHGAIYLNTALNDQYDATPKVNAYTMQHEFGHVLGMAHPFQYNKGTRNQSVMSYDTPRHRGSQLYPADINALRNLMGYNKQYEAAKLAAAKNKAVNKKTNRR